MKPLFNSSCLTTPFTIFPMYLLIVHSLDFVNKFLYTFVNTHHFRSCWRLIPILITLLLSLFVKIRLIFNPPPTSLKLSYPNVCWILLLIFVVVTFVQLLALLCSVSPFKRQYHVVGKDTDSGFLSLDLSLPSCVNLGKTLILCVAVPSSGQWVNGCWLLAGSFSSSPHGPFHGTAWVFSQHGNWFPPEHRTEATMSFIT